MVHEGGGRLVRLELVRAVGYRSDRPLNDVGTDASPVEKGPARGTRVLNLTTVETSVFDIKSRRLLMRAGGISTIKGTATMVGLACPRSAHKRIQ